MSEQIEDKVPELFRKVVQSFSGCTSGNVDSPVWLCGLEWGGGLSTKVPTIFDSSDVYGFKDLQCWSWQDFVGAFWAGKSKFCQNALKVLLTIQNKGKYSKDQYDKKWDELEKHRTVGPNGIALILNAFPISFAGRSVAADAWKKYEVLLLPEGKTQSFSEWTGLDNFGKYKEFVVKHRSPTFIAERKKRCPKLIVCFGKDSKDDFKNIWGASGEEDFSISMEEGGKSDSFGYVLDNFNEDGTPKKEKTVLFITPFIANRYGLNSDEKIEKVFSELYGEMEKRLGSDWLGEYAWRENPPEPKNPKVDEFKNLRDKYLDYNKKMKEFRWGKDKDSISRDSVLRQIGLLASIQPENFIKPEEPPKGLKESIDLYRTLLVSKLNDLVQQENDVRQKQKESKIAESLWKLKRKTI